MNKICILDFFNLTCYITLTSVQIFIVGVFFSASFYYYSFSLCVAMKLQDIWKENKVGMFPIERKVQ